MTEITLSMYVCFDNDGNIVKIANYKDPDYSFIQVGYDSVLSILDGTDSLQNYRVVKAPNGFKLKKLETENLNSYNVDDRIYLIPKSKVDPLIFVIQDIKNKKWIFKINSEIKDDFFENQFLSKIKMIFSVTAESDPNIFYRLIEVDFDNLIDKDFEIPFRYKEEESVSVGVYTHKRLNSYKHEVIDE